MKTSDLPTGRLPDEVRDRLIAAANIEPQKSPGGSPARTRAINAVTIKAWFVYPKFFKE